MTEVRVTLSTDLCDALDALAQARRVSRSEVIREACRQHLGPVEREPVPKPREPRPPEQKPRVYGRRVSEWQRGERSGSDG